jgi:putative membrane protein
MMTWGMSGMMAFMVLGWIVLIAAIVAGTWWLAMVVRSARRNSALEILRERYARGEISKEEYETRRRDLAA